MKQPEPPQPAPSGVTDEEIISAAVECVNKDGLKFLPESLRATFARETAALRAEAEANKLRADEWQAKFCRCSEALEAATQRAEKAEEWKRQQLAVIAWWDKIDSFVRTHGEPKDLGRNVSAIALEWLAERDRLKGELADLQKLYASIVRYSVNADSELAALKAAPQGWPTVADIDQVWSGHPDLIEDDQERVLHLFTQRHNAIVKELEAKAADAGRLLTGLERANAENEKLRGLVGEAAAFLPLARDLADGIIKDQINAALAKLREAGK